MSASAEIVIPISKPSLLETRGLIAGDWRDGPDGKTFPVIEPSTGDVLRHCSNFAHSEFVEAIDCADKGFRQFSSSTTAKERATMLRKWYELIMENVEDCKKLSRPAFG